MNCYEWISIACNEHENLPCPFLQLGNKSQRNDKILFLRGEVYSVLLSSFRFLSLLSSSFPSPFSHRDIITYCVYCYFHCMALHCNVGSLFTFNGHYVFVPYFPCELFRLSFSYSFDTVKALGFVNFIPSDSYECDIFEYIPRYRYCL